MTDIPKGFHFATAAAGFKKPGRDDLALIASDRPAAAAGVFTKNLFQAAPVLQCKAMLARTDRASAFLVNSGQANASTGEEGLNRCRETLNMVGKATGLPADEILPASTGVIGPQLIMEKWEAAVPALADTLGKASPEDAAKAIMTTDTVHKLASATVTLSGGTVRLLGMCKGAGMICPNMATMLGFICCDADVSPGRWRDMLAGCALKTFNHITIDGDTSTNDCVMGLANGASGVAVESDMDLDLLEQALMDLCRDLAYMIVRDAEGGTKVAHISVSGAMDDKQAELVARAVGHSPLVKTALFGCDPNWGRITAAAGRSGAMFDPSKLVLTIGGIAIYENGGPVSGDMDVLLEPVMAEADIEIGIDLGAGEGKYTLLASDLSREYVSINADYRS
ncbi:bifunctional glutamate N-acetyltransferase/amino-acid acetyltransferase ArgJ [Salidesulfovibrio brasiliensis]|uniref:bifunctional glutamate N-acetyltransferase/amino-acid acetyltransferase ArgJ n=1 Tax=Salidesulfovibrio brasiliensis TaxID=221711 RepID=UPI0006D046DB|nr:bifunctional glutamate N-acetyltransferase/amino-acid acetyltransferase ArgJ [Salidesulfovibrio brasiliensis]